MGNAAGVKNLYKNDESLVVSRGKPNHGLNIRCSVADTRWISPAQLGFSKSVWLSTMHLIA
jgi:hypothetical protein